MGQRCVLVSSGMGGDKGLELMTAGPEEGRRVPMPRSTNELSIPDV